MELARVLSHPRVAAVDLDGDRSKLAKVFLKALEDEDNKWPIDFDDAWQFLNYNNKGNGLRKLKTTMFKEGVDYKHESIHEDRRGRPYEKYYLTTSAFEHFAMASPTSCGELVREFFRAIRDAYIEILKTTQPVLTKEQAQLLTYDAKKCIYVGVIQEEPIRICKFGQTSNVRERYKEHKRTFTTPYFFQLLHVVEADDCKKAEDFFRAMPDIRANSHPVKVGASIQQETFVMPATLSDTKLHYLMRTAARQATSQDLLMADERERASHLVAVEKEKTLQAMEKTKQVDLEYKLKLEMYRLDHEYRLQCLAQREGGPLADEPLNVEVSPESPLEKQAPHRDHSCLEDQPEHPVEYVEQLQDAIRDPLPLLDRLNCFLQSCCELGEDDPTLARDDRFYVKKKDLFQAFFEAGNHDDRDTAFAAQLLQVHGIRIGTVNETGYKTEPCWYGIRLTLELRPSRATLAEVLFRRFIDECCELGEDYRDNTKQLYSRFMQYCSTQEPDQTKLSKTEGFSHYKFAAMLEKIGVAKQDWGWGGKLHAFLGIRVKGSGAATRKEMMEAFLREKTQRVLGSKVKCATVYEQFAHFAKERYPNNVLLLRKGFSKTMVELGYTVINGSTLLYRNLELV